MTITSTEQQKIRFDEKIQELRASQGKNARIISDADYSSFISKIKEIKSAGYKMKPQDFNLLKRFEVLQVEKDGEIIEKLVKPGTSLRFVTYEGLFAPRILCFYPIFQIQVHLFFMYISF